MSARPDELEITKPRGGVFVPSGKAYAGARVNLESDWGKENGYRYARRKF